MDSTIAVDRGLVVSRWYPVASLKRIVQEGWLSVGNIIGDHPHRAASEATDAVVPTRLVARSLTSDMGAVILRPVLLHQSDRSSQYGSECCRESMRTVASMSQAASCYHDAKLEGGSITRSKANSSAATYLLHAYTKERHPPSIYMKVPLELARQRLSS